ncbi:MAG TPA: hypothetical protein VI316_03675 [Candidatus Dormibacteraeota bacterium]
MDESGGGVDLSGLHRELDRLKTQLCRCNHTGECLACRGFEILRQQSQTVVAAASQPVLMQVAQEAAVKDLVQQLGGVSEKLTEDPRLQDLMGQLMERIQEDLGGPDAMQHLLKQFGGFGAIPGFPGAEPPTQSDPETPAPDERPPQRPYDDLGPEERSPRRPQD